MRVCRVCNENKSLDDFGWDTSYGARRCKYTKCKSCRSKYNSELRELHKQRATPPIGTPCECCGTVTTYKLNLDHDPETKEIRGFVCRICNNGVLSGNRTRFLHAARYLGYPAMAPG